jgi:hypothetical protein
MSSARSLAALACLIALSTAAPAARADPPAPAATAERPASRRTQWYGWQILAADAPLFVAAIKARPLALTLLGSGPIIHLLHGEDERAQASLAVRLVGAMFGAATTGFILADRSCDKGTTCPPGMYTIMRGAHIGLLVSELVDVSFIGWTSTADGDDALPPLVSRRERAPRTMPALLVGDGSVVLSVSGAF